MKSSKITLIASLAMAAVAFSSCSMDVIPPESIASETFWKNEKDATLALNAIYANMPGFNIHPEMEVDNAHSHKPWEGPYEQIQMGQVSPADDRGYSFHTVRLVNNYLAQVDQCDMDPALKERMKAEARFFRAMTYMTLTNTFGKVPLVTTVMDYNEPGLARNEVAEVQKFVLDELTAIAAILPDSYSGGATAPNQAGRVTKGAALALKARAALSFADFATAEAAAKAVMSLGKYSLFRVTTLNDAQKKEAAEMDAYIDYAAKGIDKDKFIKGLFSYTSLWHKANANPKNPEYILTREFQASANNNDYTRYIYLRTSQLVRGYASYEPIQDLISAYWDIDGKTVRPDPTMAERKQMFDEITAVFATCVDQQAFLGKVPTVDLMQYDYMKEFRNRDARLYGSILTPFKGWHETDMGTFYYRVDPNKIGIDGNETWTGYAFRKMVSLTAYNLQYASEDYPTIRYAEVLLTYAEARTEASGYDGQVQAALNDLRDRCGMPNVPASFASKQEALDFIRNERRIELAGEGHRWVDIRRYGKAYCAKVMSGKTYAPNGYMLVDKGWKDRMMLMPIPQTAREKNQNLDQNDGYGE